MKVVFDLDAALRNRYSGFYTFASGLLRGINLLQERPDMILLFQKRYEKEAGNIVSGLGAWAEPRPCPFRFRWIENLWRFLPRPSMKSLAGEFDLFHCFHHFMPSQKTKPRLLTIHDLRRYRLPEMYPGSRLRPFETAVKRADHFIAVSESTRKDLCRIFDIDPGRVDVVHLACGRKIPALDKRRIEEMKRRLIERYGLKFENYLICFSSKDRRKNIKRTTEAFKAALSDLPEGMGLVIVGRLPPSLEINSQYIFTPGPVDDIIPWLVSSNGLIFTSLYEGFGLPILEGFQAGIPVITSNCSSMPEVSGDAAILVDPYDARQIRDAINTIVLDKNAARSLVDAGRKRLEHFSWKKTAEKTAAIYQKLVRIDPSHAGRSYGKG